MSNFQEESNIPNLVAQTPMSEATPIELKARLRMMASSTKVKAPSAWPARLAVLGVGGVAVAAFTLSMAPSKAWSFQKVMNAVEHHDTFQISLLSGDGNGDHRVNIVGRDGKFVLKADNGAIVQVDSSMVQIYDPKQNTVMDLKIGGLVDPKKIASELQKSLAQGLKEMDIKQMMARYQRQYGEENIHVSPIHQRWGKSTYDVTLESPTQPDRVFMTVNADTDLPEKIEVQHKGGVNGGEGNSVVEVNFGGEVSDEMMKTQIPANAKHTSLDIEELVKEGMKSMPFKGMGQNSDRETR